MCEMLGMTAKRKRRANGLLREFYSHAEAHPHGWGLARFPVGAAPHSMCLRASSVVFAQARLNEERNHGTLILEKSHLPSVFSRRAMNPSAFGSYRGHAASVPE